MKFSDRFVFCILSWTDLLFFTFHSILFYMLMSLSDDLSAHAVMETVSQFST